MASQASRMTSSIRNAAVPFAGYPSQAAARSVAGGVCTSNVTAYSVEFVAKPGEALKAQSALAPAITGTLNEVTGFAGCILMTSDQEARLMTVVTFWRGSDRMKHCNANVRWVNALLAPYMDRKLRVQTMVAQLPGASLLESGTASPNESASNDVYAEREDEVCVA
jgi:hypothetical protein